MLRAARNALLAFLVMKKCRQQGDARNGIKVYLRSDIENLATVGATKNA